MSWNGSRSGGDVPWVIHSKTCHRSEFRSVFGCALRSRSRWDQPALVRYLTAWNATSSASRWVYQFPIAERRERPQPRMELT